MNAFSHSHLYKRFCSSDHERKKQTIIFSLAMDQQGQLTILHLAMFYIISLFAVGEPMANLKYNRSLA